MPTDDELQRAFRLISFLHPDRAVALCVLQDACDRISVIRRVQQRRPDSSRPFKLKIPEESLTQLGAYGASEIWEKDQESEHPQKEPRYKPNADDMLARYVKTIIWKAMDRPSRYAAVGLGCLLYTYQPHEVSSLAEEFFDSDNIRRDKSWMFEQIKLRFGRARGLTNGHEYVALERPSSRQRELIQKSLSVFTPWSSCPASNGRAPGASLLEIYFDRRSELTELERVHVLCDPACGGLPRLVHEYNSIYGRGNEMRLDDPEEKLGSPNFGGGPRGPEVNGGDDGPPDPDERFNPPQLTRHELSSIKHSVERNQRRRKNHSSGRLRVCIDGEEVAAVADEHFAEPFAVPDTASCIEVFGEDDEGELLLAVFPLNCMEPDEGAATLQLSVTHEGGQTIELTLSPQSQESRETVAWLSYAESPRAFQTGLVDFHFTPHVHVGGAIFGAGSVDLRVDGSRAECDAPEAGVTPAAVYTAHASCDGADGSGLPDGEVVGRRYRIVGRFGFGGMGAVYLAQDKKLGENVAIKVMGPCDRALHVEEECKRILWESHKALARACHPGVERPLDFGELHDGRPYVVTELVPGVSLRDELCRQAMEPPRIADVSTQIAAALGALHDVGVIHRDVKPANIILSEVDGRARVKLIDFGLMRVLDAHGSSPAGATDHALDGCYIGTSLYTAPELLRGEPATAASDIWSLGCVLYEMLTGCRPFNTESPSRLLELQRAGADLDAVDVFYFPLQRARDVLAKALAFEPRRRYRSAEEFGAVIEGALAGQWWKTASGGPTRAHVLFLDAVTYSGLTAAEQYRWLNELMYTVSGTKQIQEARERDQLLSLSTGDGLALVFTGDDPLVAVQCAVEIAQAFKSRPEFKLRMGVHTHPSWIGGVGGPGVLCDAVRVARHLTDCGNAGGISLSKAAADELNRCGGWSRYLQDRGERLDKHGHRVHIFNLYTGKVGDP